MNLNRFKTASSFISSADRKRRKRELIIIAVIIVVVALMTYAQNKLIHFGANFPISNTILMFTMTNINLLLLILMIFLVFRNLVKLLYDRRRKVMGSKLRTRLVIAFVSLTLIPASVMFFFSMGFITTSIDFWFNVPVEQALENSLHVGRQIYGITENSNAFFLDRTAHQIKTRKLLEPARVKELLQYVEIVQRSFNLDAVEVYNIHARRIAQSLGRDLNTQSLQAVSIEQLRKEFSPKSVSSFSQLISGGEAIRTVGTIPFGVKPSDAEAFLVLTVMIPPYLSENMASISRGFEEYQQIKLLKKPIQISYYITLSIVGLLVVFCAVWFGFYLAKSISIPIKELAEGTRRVAEGDLSFQIGSVGDDSFNKMTRDLRLSRDQLELTSNKLREQNLEIEEKRQYMEIVLKNVSAGVVTLDAGGFIATINTSAEKMLNISAAQVVGKNYVRLLQGRYLKMAEEIIHGFKGIYNDFIELPLRVTIEGRPRSFMLHISSLKDDSGRHIGIVVVFDDLTELEKAQRTAAWREVARRIAHEVKNPLTPITLSAQRLKRKYSRLIKEPVFDECTQMIIDHVDIIRNLVNEFSSFARFPSANPKPGEILPIIEETIALYREGHSAVRFKIKKSGNIPVINLDRQQIKRAMINLVDNAVSAIHSEGDITISLSHDVANKLVRVEVADNGHGISDEDKVRLFEPDFSTKVTGMGLGLAIVNTIVMDHHGTIRAEDNHPSGAKFIFELPV
ncbi:MAG: ATP-binding protein [Deltaproteobacteria bacterium]|nr:ATP-binding protein [Deltaproteobacteria bacterium]